VFWASLVLDTSATRGLLVALGTTGDDSSTLRRALYDRAVRLDVGIEPPDPAFGYTIRNTPTDDPSDRAGILAANPSFAEGLLDWSSNDAHLRMPACTSSAIMASISGSVGRSCMPPSVAPFTTSDTCVPRYRCG
jgi:hypothetical protein